MRNWLASHSRCWSAKRSTPRNCQQLLKTANGNAEPVRESEASSAILAATVPQR